MDLHFGLENLFCVLTVLLCVAASFLPHISAVRLASVALALCVAKAILKDLVSVALGASKLYVTDLNPLSRTSDLLSIGLAPIWSAIFITRLTEDRGILDDSARPFPPN